jgi:hypothetical protein
MSLSREPVSLPELHQRIIDQIDALIAEAETHHRPLEVDPARSRLFELFVMAEAAGCVGEQSDPDLSADGICATLSEQWGLKEAAQGAVRDQSQIPPAQLARMRSLWSVMRMWMEWTYAWQRWPEFHNDQIT